MRFVPALVAPPSVESCVWFAVHADGLVVRQDGAGAVLPRDDELRAAGVSPDTAEYLGQLDGAHVFAAAIEQPPPPPFVLRGLRSLYGPLDEETWSLAGRAVQIAHWRVTHRFCGRCGAPMGGKPRERARACAACALICYPRISPAIIVLVRRGRQALLARNARVKLPFYSTLAGFAEAGESLEETLAREVREEVGLEVRDLRYFGSQSWPFPHSLMVGFFAEHAGGDIRVDEDEISEAQWFDADRLPPIPPRISIARSLIDAWIDEVRGAPSPPRGHV
jgi:NAD+ diphosphatase